MISSTSNNTGRTRRCLVFGGSGTLGKEVCAQLKAAGAWVSFTYHKNRLAAQELVSLYTNIYAYPLNLANPEEIREVVRAATLKMDGIDSFIHCAAIGPKKGEDRGSRGFPSLHEISVDDWDEVIAVNLRSAIIAASVIEETMVTTSGNLVFIGSIDGVKSMPASIHYAVSKGALSIVARVLAKEFAGKNIFVNTIVPGIMDAGLSQTLSNEQKNEYLKHCSLSRFATPREVASTAVWLALHNTYLNGQSFVVDGGL